MSPISTLSRRALMASLGLTLLLAFSASAPCNAQDEEAKKKLVVLCSTTQIADFTRQVVGDRWEVVCVMAAGEDPHIYEVGNDDLLTIKPADLCIQNGWHLEGLSLIHI